MKIEAIREMKKMKRKINALIAKKLNILLSSGIFSLDFC